MSASWHPCVRPTQRAFGQFWRLTVAFARSVLCGGNRSTRSTSQLCRVVVHIASAWLCFFVFKRREDTLYNIDIHQNKVYVHTNYGANINFIVFEMPHDALAELDPSADISIALEKHGKILLRHSETEFIEKLQLYEKHAVVWIRSHGLRTFKVYSLPDFQLVHEYNIERYLYTIFPSNIGDMVSL